MSWFAHPDDSANDPRWRVVELELGCSPRDAHDTWVLLMAHANRARPRGSVRGFDPRAICTVWRWDLALVLRIVEVFRAHGWIDANDRLVEWVNSQPNKGQSTNAERQRRHRAKVKKQPERNGSNGRDARDDTVTAVTSNAVTALPTEQRSVGNASAPALDLESSSQPETTSLSHTSRAGARDEGEGGGWISGLFGRKRRHA